MANGQRVSRRELLRMAGLGLGAIGLAACSAAPAAPTAAPAKPTEPPKPVATAAAPSVASSGTITIGQPSSPAHLDWMRHADLNAHEIDRQIIDTLLMRNQKT